MTCRPSGGQKKWQTLATKKFWLGGNYLNYYYHPVRAPPRDKQSCGLCNIDITSLLIHSCSILCLNISKLRCFAARWWPAQATTAEATTAHAFHLNMTSK